MVEEISEVLVDHISYPTPQLPATMATLDNLFGYDANQSLAAVAAAVAGVSTLLHGYQNS